MASLAEIRQRLAAAEANKGGIGTPGDGAIYPHWNMEENSSALVRFLPDGNTRNTFFWVERAMIKLPFAGIKGEAESRQVQVQVPCVEMWGDTCPVLTEVRTWFKDKSLEDMGRKYWKKRSYIFQGFVRENPLADDKTPDNPIRRFIIGPQIFQTIKAALMDPELEELPTDYQRGLDFRIAKTTKGGYADYNTSKWSRKESALTQAELEAIQQHGLFDLTEFLPKRPTDVELRVIKEMFEASVDGQPYDPERWGAYFRPAGVAAPAAASDTESADPAPVATAPRPAPVAPRPAAAVAQSTAASDTPPWDGDDADTVSSSAPIRTAPASTGTQSAQDILAMIRARQNKSA